MLREEIESTIAYIKEQIKKFGEMLEDAEQNVRDFTEAAEKLTKKAGDISSGLDTTLSTIDGKLSRVNQNSKFPSMYREKARSILMSSNSEQAIRLTSGAAGTAKAKVKDLEKETLEDKVRYWLQQLWEAI